MKAWVVTSKLLHFVSSRACLHGVGDLGLVGLVSFVFTLWGTQKKGTYPTRPESPTPCKQGLTDIFIMLDAKLIKPRSLM